MNDVILKLVIPGGSIAAAGVVALMMTQEAAIMKGDFTPPPVTASELQLTEVIDTAAPTGREEPTFPIAPSATQAAQALSVPLRPLAPASDVVSSPLVDSAVTPLEVASEPGEVDVEITSAEITTDACSVQMDATPRAAALLTVTINAPCAPNTRVELWHEGLVLAGVTNEQGNALINMPALATPALLRAGLADGTARQLKLMFRTCANITALFCKLERYRTLKSTCLRARRIMRPTAMFTLATHAQLPMRCPAMAGS